MEGAYRQEPAVSTSVVNKKPCGACANTLDVRAEFCPRCGVRQPMMAAMGMPGAPSSAILTSRNRLVAALLAFFLGGFGIHKFYLGRPKVGILYLVLFWTIVPAVIAFIEGIILLMQSDASFAQQYPG